jgi:hypothetical protein
MALDKMEIMSIDDNSINSSDYASMRQSIVHSKLNKITLDNISVSYVFEDKISFSTSILRKYEHVIMQNLLDYTLFPHQILRPEYASYDMYGTTDLWYLLLFINNMTRPSEFNKRNIKAFNPARIELLNDIIEKEKKLLHDTKENPIKIKRELLKDLNQPSKSILSSNYDKKIKPLTPPTPPKRLNTITDYTTSFVTENKTTLRNKLIKRSYAIADSSGNLVSHIKTDISNNIKLDIDNDSGFPSTWNNRYRQEFEGYIYAGNTGEYEFKPVIMGHSRAWINDKEIFSIGSDNFTVGENLFESQSYNSDFKKGNLDGWNVLEGELYDDNGKTVLRNAYNLDTSGSNMASIDLDLTYVRTYEDLVLTTTYKAINNRNMLFSGATAEVRYTNGLVETFSNNSKYSHFNNNGEYINAMLVVTLHKTLTLQSITINFPVDRLPVFNDTANGEVMISSLKVQKILYKTHKIVLDGGRWHKFKFQYDMIDQPSSYLQLLWRKPSDNMFQKISTSLFAFSPEPAVTGIELPSTVINKLYSHDEKVMFTQSLADSSDFSLADSNPDSLFVPANTNYILKQESTLSITAERRYRIEANEDDIVEVYKDGLLWFNKPAGQSWIEQSFNEAPVNKKSSIKVVYKHTVGNGNAYFRLKMFPDEYGNPVWGNVMSKNSLVLDELLSPWEVYGNSVSLVPYIAGTSKYFFDDGDDLKNYRIKTMVDIDDMTHHGSVGIMFRMQGEDEYYLYTIRREGQPDGTQKSLMSGLYKVSPLFSEISMSSDRMFTIRANLLATTTQKYTSTESKYIFIMLTENTIRVYDQINGNPIIEYVDNDNPFMNGGFGFHVFKQSQVNFSDIEVLY